LSTFCIIRNNFENEAKSKRLLQVLSLAGIQIEPIIFQSPQFCHLPTETALKKGWDYIISVIDKGSIITLMSFDTPSGFHPVIHDTLIQRLEDEFEMTGHCHQWITF
jgi:hypothetical protein